MLLSRALAFLCAVSVASMPGTAEPRQPTGKWVVDYAADSCLLSRAYGTEDRPLLLIFEKLPLSDDVGLYAIRMTDRDDVNSGKADIGFGPAQRKQISFSAVPTARHRVRRISMRVDGDVLGGAAASGSISVSAAKEINETFAVPNLAAAFDALNNCALDLGRVWGMPVEQQKRLKREPKPVQPLNKYFNSSLYPDAALKNGEMGQGKVRVDIDTGGNPTNCVLTRPTGSKSLDETTCRVLRKVHFEPALDADGRPMNSFYVTTIAWLIAG